MNHDQQKRLERSEQLIQLHCQLMRRPRPDSTCQRLAKQIRNVFQMINQEVFHG